MSQASQASNPVAPPEVGRNPKHPVAVGHSQDGVLLAWTEGTTWGKGGDVAWQRFDSGGKPAGSKRQVPGLPTWSLVAAVATQDDRFVIVY